MAANSAAKRYWRFNNKMLIMRQVSLFSESELNKHEPANSVLASVIERLSFRGKRLYKTICEYSKGDGKTFFLNEKAIDYHLADFGASTAIWELKRNGLVDFNVEYHENMNFRKEMWYRGRVLNAL